MKIPGYRRIFKTDYTQEEQSLVEKLSVSINNGFETIYEALNNKLDFTNNFQGTDVSIRIQVDSSGIPIGNSSFKLSNTNKVNRIWVGRADNLTNSNTYPTGAPFVNWVQNSGTITITHITGLQEDNVYLLNLLAT